MKIAIVGAGFSGLVAGKYSKQFGHEFVIFEQASKLGGTWNYEESTGKDQNGLDIHPSMYINLWTNLPKETMAYSDFNYPQMERSFLRHQEVLAYMNAYVDHFGFRSWIRFEHHVLEVRPLDGGRWEVTVDNFIEKKRVKDIFDAIFICSGHYKEAFQPQIDGLERFRRPTSHVHTYRRPEMFAGMQVLVVGASSSGLDIALDLAKVTKKVYLSHNLNKSIEKHFCGTNVEIKTSIERFLENEIQFKDGSNIGIDDVDHILFCTGYNYSFPFLDPECEITVKNNHVQPLYKQIVNINHPTMFFIGIPYISIIILMLDMQVRFSLKLLHGEKQLPSREEMLRDLEKGVKLLQELGYKHHRMHMLGRVGDLFLNENYLRELAEMSDEKPIPQVYWNIFKRSRDLAENVNLQDYRNFCYEIVDEENFIERRMD